MISLLAHAGTRTQGRRLLARSASPPIEIAMDPLIEGYRRFRREVWPSERARYEALAKGGQSPDTLVIACSDSRVDPQTIFSAVPGELFVVRNVGGIAPPFSPDGGYHGTSAAIEFAVQVLKVQRIVVLGHAQCGGVRAMVEGAPPQAREFVASWVEMARPAFKPVAGSYKPEQVFDLYEVEVVRLSLRNLLTFPWIAAAVRAGALELSGFRFDIHTGVLSQIAADATAAVEEQ